MQRCLAVLLVVALVAGIDRPPEPPVVFFNGKDLTGWQGLEKYWSVKDGALVGSTAPDGLRFNTFLCSRQQFGDFELSFRVRLSGPAANSGVQVRSAVFDQEHFAVKGPQCDMGQQYWGSLYGEHFGGEPDANGLDKGGMMQAAAPELVRKTLKEGDFNDYAIRCVGKRVTITLNGQTTVDGEFPTIPDRGIVAFQIHGGPAMEVVFKDIQFKDLSR